MILKDLKIFSQNVQKNNFLINTILEVNQNFNIIFIQELLWTTIRTIPSSANCKGIPLVGIPNHPIWLTFARELCSANDSPRIIESLFMLISDFLIFDFIFAQTLLTIKTFYLHLFSTTITSFRLMNVYSNSSHSALKYLKDTEVNILNLLIMTGNFNIKDSIWDPSFSYHSTISDDLIIIVDSFNLDLLIPTNQVSTRYFDIVGKANSVIDLIFL